MRKTPKNIVEQVEEPVKIARNGREEFILKY
ncbi:hypothetical protein Clocl_0728 [Acetivibrio clariflavus DSM 19732]|uniref:Uncharacterized protein n=1 Tax=Acetivibrio clariflavus (strain DSM 19732 / NBRC 101661 / EBR45) TaxID=720554 RepID=G8LV76_ACECE|nr:hypothetical protein Clocl_0728 [Acetivibrio clariflavus DSM 19732]